MNNEPSTANDDNAILLMHHRWEVLVDSRYCSSWKVQTGAAVRFVSYTTWVVFHVDIRIPRESSQFCPIHLDWYPWCSTSETWDKTCIIMHQLQWVLFQDCCITSKVPLLPKMIITFWVIFFGGRDTLEPGTNISTYLSPGEEGTIPRRFDLRRVW